MKRGVPGQHNGLGGFARRVLLALLLISIAIAAWKLVDLVLLVFAAALIAVGLSGAASALRSATGITNGLGLAVVVSALLVILAAAFWFFGRTVADQLDEVGQQLPTGLDLLVARLQSHPYGRYVLDQIRAANVVGATGWAGGVLATVAGLLARSLAYAVLTFFAAIYLAAQPGLYRRICIRLTPPAYRPQTGELLDKSSNILRRWLVGQVVVMATIGTLSGIGLWLLGVEAALALGFLGGLLSFIPYVGAILAAVPATLVALTQGPVYAGSVVLMYAGVHFVEGNFITPMVQAEATSLPPVLSLFSTVAFSVLFGPSSVLIAAPLTLFVMVVIEVLYVEHALGEWADTRERPYTQPRLWD